MISLFVFDCSSFFPVLYGYICCGYDICFVLIHSFSVPSYKLTYKSHDFNSFQHYYCFVNIIIIPPLLYQKHSCEDFCSAFPSASVPVIIDLQINGIVIHK